MYPEIQESPGAKAQMVLYGSPGTLAYAMVGEGPVRGLLNIENFTSIVSGTNYFRMDPGGTVTNYGSVGSDGLPVQMVASTTQVLIVSGGNAFVHDGTGVHPVQSPPWTKAVDCAFIDGFFVILDDNGPAGGQFFISALLDATSWDPLDFSTSPSSNNQLLALAVDHDELWVFGSVVTQPFYNNGNADFPFVANQTAIVMQGIENRDTRQNLDNTLFWLGRNNYGTLQAFLADGYRPLRISDHPIEQQWLKYQNPSDCTAWTYQINGHPTWHINFNTDQKSWRYDRATGKWHRVAYRNSPTNVGQAHRGNCHCVRNGLHIIGDRQTGQLWQLSPTVYQDGGLPLVALRRGPAFFQGNKTVFFKLFELITPPGIGDGSDPNATPPTPEQNPAWMLRWSNDSGHNYSNEYQLQAGPQGAYSTRLRKVGCGSARNRNFEVSISANVPRCLIGAQVEIELGTS